MKVRKIIVLLVTVCLLSAFVFAGCNSKSTTPDQKSSQAGVASSPQDSTTAESTTASTADSKLAPENLIIYAVGDKGEGSDMRVEKVNEKLKEKLNTTITANYLPWTTWESQYQLIFASGEEFDAIYAANWTFYSQMAVKNGFIEITHDMLEKNAPDVLTELPEAAWRQAKINGKIYMIPTTFDEYLFSQIAIRGDLREKYNVPPIKSLDDLGVFLDAMKKNEKDILPLRAENTYLPQLLTISMESLPIAGAGYTGMFYYKYTDPGTEIYNLFETPEFKAFVEKMHQWQKAGYWSKNALLDKSILTDQFKKGQVAAIMHNMGNVDTFYRDAKIKQPEWKVEIYDGSFGKKVTTTQYIGSGVGIHASSKKVERTLMFINYARTDKDLNQLMCYGIKDYHWTDMSGNKFNISSADDVKSVGVNSISWMFRNNEFQKQPVDSSPQMFELYDDFAKRTVTHPLQNFNFDSSNVKNEMAAITNCYDQYAVPLIVGITDPSTGIDLLKKKLKEAGVEKVLQEMQNQADAFSKSYNEPVWQK